MHLKLRQLAVFHAVMEEGSVSRAAERMGLTQPAVSLALSTLEETLGFSLSFSKVSFLQLSGAGTMKFVGLATSDGSKRNKGT